MDDRRCLRSALTDSMTFILLEMKRTSANYHVELIGTTHPSRHVAAILARRGDVGFSELVQAIVPARRVIAHDDGSTERYSIRASKSR